MSFNVGFFQTNLPILFLSLHPVVWGFPLRLCWHSLLFMVVFYTSMPTSWRVFLICWTISSPFKGLFCLPLHWSSIFHLPVCLPLLSSLLCSCFLTMYQMVDFITPHFLALSLIDLLWFCSLMMACFTAIHTSLVRMLRDENNRLQIQMALNSFMHELTMKLDSPVRESFEQPINFGPLKLEGLRIKAATISTLFTQYGCKKKLIKWLKLKSTLYIHCQISNWMCWCTEPKQPKMCHCPNTSGLHCMYFYRRWAVALSSMDISLVGYIPYCRVRAFNRGLAHLWRVFDDTVWVSGQNWYAMVNISKHKTFSIKLLMSSHECLWSLVGVARWEMFENPCYGSLYEEWNIC